VTSSNVQEAAVLEGIRVRPEEDSPAAGDHQDIHLAGVGRRTGLEAALLVHLEELRTVAAARIAVADLGVRRIEAAADRIDQVEGLDRIAVVGRTVQEGVLHRHRPQGGLSSHLCCRTNGRLRREGASRSRDRG
jgi:hypothetical protein